MTVHINIVYEFDIVSGGYGGTSTVVLGTFFALFNRMLKTVIVNYV